MAGIILHMNCVQENSGINGPVRKSISGCSFSLNFFNELGITDHNRWSWQILFLRGKLVQHLGNALSELGQ